MKFVFALVVGTCITAFAADNDAPVLYLDDSAPLPCPTAALIDSLAERGIAAVSQPRKPKPDQDLLLRLLAGPSDWELRLTSASGEVAMRRTFPTASLTCTELIIAVTSAVDRFLTEISWRGQDAPIQPLLRHRASSGASLLSQAPSDSGWLKRGSLALGPAARWGAPSGFAPGLEVDLTVQVKAVSASIWFFGGDIQDTPVVFQGQPRGVLRARPMLLFAAAGLCEAFSKLSLCGGPTAGLEMAWASTTGQIYQRRSGSGVVPALGAFGSLRYPLPWRFELQAEIRAILPLGSYSLSVEGTDSQYRAPNFDSIFALRMGWRFF